MVFWQTNTWFQMGAWSTVGTWNMLGTWVAKLNLNTNAKTMQTRNIANSAVSWLVTYNSRYPWFDEEDYKRLESMVDAKWLTGQAKTDTMDELYQYYYPQVLNKHRLDERQQVINNSVHENGNLLLNWNKEIERSLKVTDLSQMAKKKFWIPYDIDDSEVVGEMVKNIPNGDKLLADYLNDWNPELLYMAWLQNRPNEKWAEIAKQKQQQWWIKSLVNRPDEWILPDAEEWFNPVGAVTETIDNAANKFAEKIMVTWENATNNLADKINNMTPEEIEAYREQYKQELKDHNWRAARVEWDTIVEQLWNGINWNFVDDYTDEWFLEWLVHWKANLWESLIGADDILLWESNPNVIRFFANIPWSAVKTFTATVRWATNPADTLAWLYKVAATKEWHDALLSRYWSWDALANAMNTDPVWVADDVNAVASILRWWVKWAASTYWKVTGNANLVNSVSNLPKFWSVMDAGTDRLTNKTYGWMDKLANASNSNIVKWINRYSQDVSSISKLTDNIKSDYNQVWEVKDKLVEWAAERLSWNKTAQDKLFQAQEPTLNRLSKERNTKQIRNKADVANELVVKDIQKNWGDLPTDTQSRVDAHERAMKNKWKEIESWIKDKKWFEISTKPIADALDDYIKQEESYKIAKNKWDIEALKEQSKIIRDMGTTDIVTLEWMKERVNSMINDRDDKSVWNTYKNWMRKVTQEMWVLEDKVIGKIPWEFQDLKNDFGALADGYGDVVKANVKAQRAKFQDSLSNYSKIKWIWDVLKWVWHMDLWEIWKWAAQAIWWEVTAKLKDKDRLITQWFKDLAAEMGNPNFKSAKKNLAWQPKYK